VPSPSYLDKDLAGDRGSDVGRAETSCTSDDFTEFAWLGLSTELAAHDQSLSLEEIDEWKPSRRLELEDGPARVSRLSLIQGRPDLRDTSQQGDELSVRRTVGDCDCIERLPDGAATALIDHGGADPRAARKDHKSHVNSEVDM
jgi:hypothetical protein